MNTGGTGRQTKPCMCLSCILSYQAPYLQHTEGDHQSIIIEPRSDKRDLLAIKVKSEIFTERVRPSCCEQLQKI